MRRKNYLAVASILLCLSLLAACGNTTPSGSSDNAETVEGQKEEADLSQESDESTADEAVDMDFEETIDDYSTAVESEDEGVVEETSDLENRDIQIGMVGTVEMTVLSSEESRSFEGKEMIADQDYLENAKSSDVYYCKEPLDRIEVHPIEQWAKDFSSYTVSQDVLGTVESTEAEEPFRIFDVYPEGIPNNCVVFYLDDGTCGSFSLGYNGSGEEHVWDNAVYKNFASMEASREKDLEEGAVNWILDLYREIAQDYEQSNLHERLLGGSIPSFGEQSLDYTGEPMYYSSERHFVEVCGGTSISGIGIARMDLNNDGTDELIIGDYNAEEESSDNSTTLFAAYSVKGGEIQTIFQGGTRSYYRLAEDGTIIHGGSGGAMNYEILRYNLAEDTDGKLSLQETEAVVVDGSSYPDEPYFYYPEGREIIGYDDYGVPEYRFESVIQMDKETGRSYYNAISEKAIHVELEEFDLLDD